MSRRMLRKSSMKKSPLNRPTPVSKETSSNEALLFEVESIDSPLSPSSDNLKEANKKRAKKKSNSVVKTPLKRETTQYNRVLSGLSLTTSTSANKTKDLTLPDVMISYASETADISALGIKKVRRKKKIRDTQDFNAIKSIDGNSYTEIKKKSKMTKKARMPSFLPPVDVIDEDKKNDIAGTSGSCTLDSDDKEKETETNKKVKKRRSRRNKKGPLVKTNSDLSDNDREPHLLDSFGKYTLDSDNKENNTDSEGNFKIGRGRSRRTKRNTLLNKNSYMLYHETENKLPVVQDNTVGTTLSGNTNSDKLDAFVSKIVSRNSLRTSVVNTIASDENQATTRRPKLKNEGTFKISSLDPENVFSPDSNTMSSFNELSTRETFDVVPTPRIKNRSIAEEISISNRVMQTVDLTDSVGELGPSPTKKNKRTTFDKSESLKGTNNEFKISEPSPSKKLKRSTFNKNNSSADIQSRGDINTPSTSTKLKHSSLDKKSLDNIESVISPSNKMSVNDRKSSFEVSFNCNKKHSSQQLLDNLNITRRDSRKSSYKKSSTEFKSSTGSEDENNKGNFVTLRRQYHTMIDFDTGNLSHEFISDGKYQNDEKLNEQKSAEKNESIVHEKFSSDSSKYFPNSNSTCEQKTSPKRGILKKSVGRFTRNLKRDTFEMVEGYCESLEKVKLQSIPTTSTIADVTLDNSANTEVHRDIFQFVTNTPTVELGHMMIGSEESVLLANSFVNQTNKSMAPRLTRMGTFTKEEKPPQSPKVEGRKSTRKRWSQVERTPILCSIPPARTHDSQIDASLNITKTKSVTFCSPKSNVTPKTCENKTVANKPKGKKSVKIESPLNTPKIRLHSPLVARKTPKPVFSASDNSILAGNCAFSEAYMSPPSSASTPFPKKKEASLLKKVLTNEKTKIDKNNKSSSRVKMPNFRKIHERQFEKMENIKELQERKAVRAQYLLSGCKLPANESPSRVTQKESRKKLLFSPSKSDELKMVNHNCASNVSKDVPKRVNKPMQHLLNKRASFEKKKKGLKSKVPVLLGYHSPLNMGKPKTATQQNSVPKAVSKPLQHLLNKRASLEKNKAELTKPESKVVTRFGFKLPAKDQLTKEEQIKAVATRSKLATNRTAENRKQVAMVRTNRRFELLMQMRSKEK